MDVVTFVQMRGFEQDWKGLSLSDDDLRGLEQTIMEAPKAAPIVKGTGGLRKLRFAPRRWSKGKRGSVRVGYVYFDDYRVVLLIVAYAKNEQDGLSTAGRKAIRILIDRERKALAKGPAR